MIIKIVDIESDFSGFNALAEISNQLLPHRLKDIQLDFSRCELFDANMVSPLYSIIAKARANLNKFQLINVNPSIRSDFITNHFISQFDFKVERFDERSDVIPFKRFDLTASAHFYEYLSTFMQAQGMPNMSELLIKRFKQSLLEIFTNAQSHSFSREGVFACGKVFDTAKKRLDFTISDAGVGIKQNVVQYTNNLDCSAQDAIKWAMTEGNTTRKGDNPGGLGLKLLKAFIQLNKGNLQIVSDDGYYKFSVLGEEFSQLSSPIQGTCVNIEINTQDESSYSLQSEHI